MKNWIPFVILGLIGLCGCSPILSRRIEVLAEGHSVMLGNDRVGVAGAEKRRPAGNPRPEKAVWELRISVANSKQERYAYKHDTIHLPSGDWKVLYFIKGKTRNRAYVKLLNPNGRIRK